MLISVTENADWYYETAFKKGNAIGDVQLTVSHLLSALGKVILDAPGINDNNHLDF